ncbi:hypothetical protein GCM10010218_14600 [Streptomyces mashuensis]|uniref:Uncharacterized protein n=1 Tax=Streptomyces mashuensis TaxID=33904 RepID=A0A919AZG9_9ACTN|nr:hypothetical protein GCM10010218_14600 [Streptomyces mashuensis]
MVAFVQGIDEIEGGVPSSGKEVTGHHTKRNPLVFVKPVTDLTFESTVSDAKRQ